MRFTAVLRRDRRFGVTIHTTPNGLLVTHVDSDGAGAAQMVEVGDLLDMQEGAPVPVTISDRVFAQQLQSIDRPITLGFSRYVENGTALDDLLSGTDVRARFFIPATALSSSS